MFDRHQRNRPLFPRITALACHAARHIQTSRGCTEHFCLAAIVPVYNNSPVIDLEMVLVNAVESSGRSHRMHVIQCRLVALHRRPEHRCVSREIANIAADVHVETIWTR